MASCGAKRFLHRPCFCRMRDSSRPATRMTNTTSRTKGIERKTLLFSIRALSWPGEGGVGGAGCNQCLLRAPRIHQKLSVALQSASERKRMTRFGRCVCVDLQGEPISKGEPLQSPSSRSGRGRRPGWREVTMETIVPNSTTAIREHLKTTGAVHKAPYRSAKIPTTTNKKTKMNNDDSRKRQKSRCFVLGTSNG